MNQPTTQKHKQPRSEAGQGIVEYLIILFFVGIAVVAIVSVLEPAIANVFSELVSDAPVAPPALLAYTPPATFTPEGGPPPPPPGPGTPSATPSPTATPTETATATTTATATNTPQYVACEYVAVDSTVLIEGEHLVYQVGGSGSAAGHNWVATLAYGGGITMQAQPNSGVDTGAGVNGPSMGYFARITTEGDYYTFVRAWPDTSNATGNDSVHTGHGTTRTSPNEGLTGWTSTSGFTWRRLDTPTHLTPGRQQLTIWMKEDGLVVDRVMWSTNPDIVAQGSGGDGGAESVAPAGCPGVPLATATNTPTATHTPTPTFTPTNTPTSTPTLTPTPTNTPVPVTVVFYSEAGNDGYVLENTETSNTGGSIDSGSTTIRIGDDNADRQYKGVVSFDTASLPDGATIVSVQLQLRRQGVNGSPQTIGGGTIYVDVAPTSGFSSNYALQTGDFQASASAVGVTSLSFPANNNDWTTGMFNAAGLTAINKTGRTQLRLYFSVDDNDNSVRDTLQVNSGDQGGTGSDPVLIVTYLP